ncbi:3-hydroxyacyl-CoA dehydrogenase family protein [Corynebacterium sp. AOP40-9SA-29]|uniref:3-hydroxyacyl-CoA dehydrogenase family protein n=1 Tax=Corynebacterium sp. AOP40-9SA-29 TaxID=3457677 RepID=UPI004033C0A4
MTDTNQPSNLPDAVGVIGGGRMGAGIAHAFLIAGSTVTVLEADSAASDAARHRVVDQVQASADRGKLPGSPSETVERLTVTANSADLAGCGLVIEAVPEDLTIKTEALTRAAKVVGDSAWIATNTSSLSVDDLAAAVGNITGRPEKVCGLHFFNPVPASKLIEVVIADATSAELAEKAPAWATALGKTPVVVKNRPGFASSRLGVAIALEAMRMVEEGVASPEDIDNAMTLGYKHPVGPLALTDIVGLDVRLGIAEYLESTLGERFAPPQILRDKVKAGDIGRKSGRGFYEYPS